MDRALIRKLYAETADEDAAANRYAELVERRVAEREESELLAKEQAMQEIKNWYIKDSGDGRVLMSGMPIPRDSDGVTRNINFVDCDFHPASDSVFENCQIDGKPIPDGPGSLYRLYNSMLDEEARTAETKAYGRAPLTEEQEQQAADDGPYGRIE